VKLKKQIDALTDAARAITFPKYDADRARFGARLREALEMNFPVRGRDVEYDDDSRTYYWQAQEVIGHLDGALVEARQTLSIDPTKPLAEEFERVEREYAAFGETRRKLVNAVLAAGGAL